MNDKNRNFLSKNIVENEKLKELSAEIQIEILKLKNLIKKRCSFCSTVQKNILFSYEANGVFYYVCSSCIIKLALNDISDYYRESDDGSKQLVKKELESISIYLTHLMKEDTKTYH